MKKFLSFLIVFAATSALMFSCIEIEEDSFDESLLVGKWESGTLFYKYNVSFVNKPTLKCFECAPACILYYSSNYIWSANHLKILK
jgi:hypothetical protein